MQSTWGLVLPHVGQGRPFDFGTALRKQLAIRLNWVFKRRMPEWVQVSVVVNACLVLALDTGIYTK